jgi:aspartyl-tRNA(Asn)/glutamyl-tRNA(Gln) amidotransferase subunit A
MERALDVFRGLGVELETVRMAPLQDYLDVKMTIAETEIFNVHRSQLIERPHEFGLQFLAQTLAGCLFDASDYVEAQRVRRRLIAQMQPLYERYDALLTISSAPAPRFDRQSILRSWLGPNIHTAFSVTGGPSIVVCNGFTQGGMPLAMQISGRPFADARIMRLAHAYERAADWRGRRPQLVPGSAPARVEPPPVLSGVAVDPEVRQEVAIRARRAGLQLDDLQLDLLCEVAPHAFAMAARVRRAFGHAEEPAASPCGID